MPSVMDARITTCAFYSSLDSFTLAQVNTVPDQVLNEQDNRFLLRVQFNILSSFALGTDMIGAQIVVPSLRPILLPRVEPIELGLTPGHLPNVMDGRTFPIVLQENENFEFQAAEAAVGPSEVYGVFNLIDGSIVPVPPQRQYVLRGTFTGTTVPNQWTPFSPDWDEELPQGKYGVIGGWVRSATGVAWRVNFEGSKFRPGGLCVAALGQHTWEGFFPGGMGLWGEFTNITMPQIDVLSGAVEIPDEIILFIIRR